MELIPFKTAGSQVPPPHFGVCRFCDGTPSRASPIPAMSQPLVQGGPAFLPRRRSWLVPRAGCGAQKFPQRRNSSGKILFQSGLQPWGSGCQQLGGDSALVLGVFDKLEVASGLAGFKVWTSSSM